MTLQQACIFIIGLIVGFYWARVIKLVRKTKRRTGRSAQLFPREPLGRFLRFFWYPAVALWCLQPWLTLLERWAVLPTPAPAPLRLLEPLEHPLVYLPAMALAILALWGTLICWRKMGTSWRMGINPGEQTTLVLSGPYAYVRHPIYGLQQALILASAAVVPTPAMIGAAVMMMLFLQWEARREEANLVEVHGEVYANYRRNTGRFFPRSVKAYHP